MTQGALLAAGERAVATQEEPASMFERLLRDPSVDVEKFERMMALHERMEAKKAEAAFNAAMTAAQKAMRPVVADSYNPQTRSKYASYEALDLALRPVYTEHGFGLSFNTADSPRDEHVRVLCKATHAGGHSELYHVDMPADGKGAKGGDVMTRTHATGSALSYGQRYLLKLIFNVAVAEDDDGNKAGGKPTPKVPDGFEDWWSDLTAAADNGIAALESAWKASRADLKAFVAKERRKEWNDLKGKAAKVSA